MLNSNDKSEVVSFVAILSKIEYIYNLTLNRQDELIYACIPLIQEDKRKLSKHDVESILKNHANYNSVPYRKIVTKNDKQLYKNIFHKRIDALSNLLFKADETRFSSETIKHGLMVILKYSHAQINIIKSIMEELGNSSNMRHQQYGVTVQFRELYEHKSIDLYSSLIVNEDHFGTVTRNIAISAPSMLLEMLMDNLIAECDLAGISMEKNESNMSSFGDDSPVIDKAVPTGPLTIQLCDPKSVANCLNRLNGLGKKVSEHIKSSLQQLINQDGIVNAVPLDKSYSDKIKLLRNQYPHMAELFNEIENNLDLESMGGFDKPLSLLPTPIILDGSPGTGKTMVAEAISKLFNTGYNVIGGAELTNPFDLTGMSAAWGTGQPGLISRMLIDEQRPSPVIVVDEVDKMGNRGDNMSPHQALYTLLEPQSAKRFKDEYLCFEFDASHINWICTSNELDKIPAPIKDRSLVINVPLPTIEQRISIIKYVYQDMQTSNTWGKYFAESLDEDLAIQLIQSSKDSIRQMKRLVFNCFTAAAKANKGKILEGILTFDEQLIHAAQNNFGTTFEKNKIKMGFI